MKNIKSDGIRDLNECELSKHNQNGDNRKSEKSGCLNNERIESTLTQCHCNISTIIDQYGELLRGPKGDMGPRGIPGPIGLPGPPGISGNK